MIKNSVLPSEKAEKALTDLFKNFDKNQYIYEGFSTVKLFKKVGVMFGILICKNTEGKEIILKAFSGQFDGNWIVPTYVPPLLDVKKFNYIYKNYNIKCLQLSKEIVKINNPIDENLLKEKIEERKRLSNIALEKINESYKIPTITGEYFSLKEIVQDKVYPSGTGDCCAPKLLGYAFSHNLHPISLAEGFYGKNTSLKQHKFMYPPCKEKCSLILPTMLNLDIIYCDEYITVVNKPAGLVTIPGRTPELKDCITARIKTLFPESIDLSAAHRLDMDTSGLIVLGRDKASHRNLSIQFQERNVEKKYLALVRGIVKKTSGVITLPLSRDINNRPYQKVDFIKGKTSKTKFNRLSVERYNKEFVTRLILMPYTGRTHQLRVHCKEKLFPIVGDRLYGIRKDNEKRMLLQAYFLAFNHPITNERLTFKIGFDF